VRELVLNHASVTPAGEHELLAWLDDLARGITVLVRAGLTQKALRMRRPPYEINCFRGGSLHDAYLSLLKKGGRGRESAAYLLGLSTKSPLLSGVSPDVEDRFLRCEGKTLPGSDGEPLVVCALTDAISVGLPSEPIWNCDRLTVAFLELLPDGTFEDAQEAIDNLTSIGHANSIVTRHRDLQRFYCADASELWRRRADLFPHLVFGPDVEDHLAKLNPGLLSTLVNRLADLDDSAAAWPYAGGAEPPWTCRVSDESESVKKNPRFRDARQFRSATGEPLLFLPHARFGIGERIHLRFDPSKKEIEIGYVGPHLPTKRYPK